MSTLNLRAGSCWPFLFVAMACASPEPDDAAQLSKYPAPPYEDSRGDLWFPTAFSGVIRHDTSGFHDYTKRSGHLPSDTVRAVFEDQDGTIWLATGGGLVQYANGKFRAWTDYDEGPGHRSQNGRAFDLDLWDVHRDRSGRLWVASLGGVHRLEGDKLVPFVIEAQAKPHTHEFTQAMVYDIYEDGDGSLWFGTDGCGAVRWDGERQHVFTTDEGLCSNHICKILRDRRGDLWFGSSNGGVSRYDGSTYTTLLRNEQHSIHNGWGRFLGIVEDRAGNVWFGRSSPGGGAWRFDGANWRLFSKEDGLSGGGVIGVSVDRRGGVWLGTTAGVYRYDGTGFTNFTRKR